MMTIREYKRAESLEEAWQLNQKKPNRILGGMIWLKMETINVGTAIDLSGLGLDTIEENEEGFSIGAMVTLRQLEQHPGLAAYTHGAMREAVRHIVGVQLRNLATVGGSIYSRFGFSDVLTMFLAMDCDVELYKGGILPLQEYAQRPYDRDILVRLIVKKTPMQLYYQSVRNSQTDIPVLTCAAARMETGDYRIVIGARPLRAVRFELPAEPALAAEQLAAQFAEGVKAQIVTGSNMRGSAEYRRHLAGVLTKRAVLELEQRKMQEDKYMQITLTLNGIRVSEEIAPDMLLIDFVRAHGCKSVKRGCETSNCGLCTVFMDDKPVLSCSVLAARADGHKITTLEGLQEEAAEFGAFIADQGAEQCGFCNPGFIMNALALFREQPYPTEEQVKEYLAGNLCRCSGYEGQLRGIMSFLAWKKQKEGVQ